ncbi:MAG: hypothetical protein PHI93_10685 [Kiritimatiellae bacterium]|nr:hypothetical protein [Kiritimatiellia bacterium]
MMPTVAHKKIGTVPPPAAADRAFLKKALAPGGRGGVSAVEDAARAWLALAASRAAAGPLVVVVESSLALEFLSQDLAALGAGKSVARLPALNVESSRTLTGQPAPDVSGERLRTLQRCLGWKGRGIVATCIQALLETVPSPERMLRLGERVVQGREYDLDALSERLVAAGYGFEAEVLAKGQASRRGGLLDVWPLTEAWPVRLEFFGDSLESLRRFDPAEQRSRENLKALMIPPANEDTTDEDRADPTDYFPDNTSFLWIDPEALLHHYAMSMELAGRASPTVVIEREFANWRLGMGRLFPGGGTWMRADMMARAIWGSSLAKAWRP